jgi:hypothetical protein
MKRAFLGAFAIAGLTSTALLLAVTQHAGAANQPCTSGAPGMFKNIGRAIVPIGIPALRGFAVDKGGATVTISNLQVTVPAEYGAVHVPSKTAYVLRLEATHAGSFDAQATWTAHYTEDDGTVVTCDASATSTLDAAKGSPLPVSPPPGGKQYKNPIIWSWRCKADSDPTPRTVTIRWEVDPRDLPLFSRGGNPPFRFTHHPRTLRATTADPCDGHQFAGFTRKRLQKGGKLTVLIGGNADSGGGGVLVKFGGEFRNPKNGNAHALHLGITIQAGTRVLAETKVCTFFQFGFVVAKGKHVGCWW